MGALFGKIKNFLFPYLSPLRLIIIGAGRIAQALVGFAGQAGYQTIVIDPRDVFATAERFPNTQLLIEWPDIALNNLKPDKRTQLYASLMIQKLMILPSRLH